MMRSPKLKGRGYQLGWTGPMTAWLMTHVIFCRDGNNEGRKGFRHPPTYSLYFIYGLSSSILLELFGRRRYIGFPNDSKESRRFQFLNN